MSERATTGEPVIRMSGLGKDFGVGDRRIRAVCDVTLDVWRGEILGVLGPNGAGKTTLMRLLSTLLLPTTGAASVRGHDIVRDPLRVRALLGAVASDERTFYGRLSTLHNLIFYGRLQGVSRHKSREAALDALALFGLESKRDAPFQSLSTGQRQRLNMARALLHDPPILLLDEPTKSMDVETSDMVRALIKEELVAVRGKTVLFVSHELSEMEDFCTRVAVMAAGRVRAVGTPAQLSERLPRRAIYRIAVQGDAPALPAAWRRLACVQRVTPVDAGARTAVFDVALADGVDDAWQELVGAVAASGARLDGYRRLDEGSLRDIVRFYAAEGADASAPTRGARP